MSNNAKCLLNTYKPYPVNFVKGKGVRVFDENNKEYLDLISGIGVNILGHAHPAIAQAVADQAQNIMHCSNLYNIIPQQQLAQKLSKEFKGGKCFFCNSGAEANEAAIKFARKYGAKAGKHEIICMENAFHGRTLGALSATGQHKYHKGFEPMLPGFKFAGFNDLASVEKAISPKTIAVFVEMVQGEGGVLPAEQDFVQGLSTLCAEKKLLLMVDEVQTGIGRTGKVFAFQHYHIKPDVVTLAKGLGGGVPIGCLMVSSTVSDVFEPGNHASTFGGNFLATRVGNVVMDTITKDRFLDEVDAKGRLFQERLEKFKAKYPFIKEIRQLGLMIGIQLNKPGKKLVDLALEKGLLINCTSENVIRFLPPLNITELEIEKALNIFENVLSQ